MKTFLGVVGLVAIFSCSIAVFSRLNHAYGLSPVAVLSLACLGMAAWVATSEARAMAAHVAGALRDIGLSLKAAALAVNMKEAQASRQLNCVDQLSLSRWSDLGPEFQRALAVRMLRGVGGYTVIEDAVLGRLVNRLESAFGTRQCGRRVA